MSKTTIYTIAKELNMSPSMVSRAFSPNAKIAAEKRALVLETAKKHNFVPNKFASRLSMQTITVGIIINSRFQVNTEKKISGAALAFESLKDYKISYDITVLNVTSSTADDYNRAFEKYKDCSGIILVGFSFEKHLHAINALYAHNPNIVQVQSVNHDANHLFSSKHNEKVASEMAAEFLYNCLRISPRKNILLLTGAKESQLHSRAEAAFKTACDTFGLTVFKSVDMNDSEECLQNILPEVFEKNGDMIDGIYITSGVSNSLCRYLEENKLYLPFVSFDIHPNIKHYLKKGIISATINQNLELQMYNAFTALVHYIIDGNPPPKIIYTDVQLVLKSNMHQFN